MFWGVVLGGFALGAVTSQSLMDGFLILMFFGLVQAWRLNKADVKRKLAPLGVEKIFISYFFISFLSLWWNGAESFQPLAKFVWILNFYLLVFAFQQIQWNANRVLKYFTWAFLPPSLYALTSYLRGTDWLTGRDNARITGLLDSATYHAHANAVIFVFFAAILLYLWPRLAIKWRLLSGGSFLLLGLSILLTFTRGVWLSLAISSVFFLAYYHFRLAIKVFIASVLVVGIGYMSWPAFQTRVNSLFQAHGGDPVRTHLWGINWDMFTENPWLGVGPTENVRLSVEYWDRPQRPAPPGWDILDSHAHNQYLNVLSTTGLFGFALFCWMWGFFIWQNWKVLRKSAADKKSFDFILSFACLWVQVEFVLACFTDVGFEYAKIRALLLATWALVMALQRRPEPSAPKGS